MKKPTGLPCSRLDHLTRAQMTDELEVLLEVVWRHLFHVRKLPVLPACQGVALRSPASPEGQPAKDADGRGLARGRERKNIERRMALGKQLNR